MAGSLEQVPIRIRNARAGEVRVDSDGSLHAAHDAGFGWADDGFANGLDPGEGNIPATDDHLPSLLHEGEQLRETVLELRDIDRCIHGLEHGQQSGQRQGSGADPGRFGGGFKFQEPEFQATGWAGYNLSLSCV